MPFLHKSDKCTKSFLMASEVQQKNIFPFTEAKLRDFNGDVSKKWYIEFAAWDVQKNKKKRSRNWDVNKYHTAASRYRFAKLALSQINNKLELGYHFDSVKRRIDEEKKQIDKDLKKSGKKTVVFLLFHGLQIIKEQRRNGTFLAYKSSLNKFCGFLEEKNLKHISYSQLNKTIILQYIDYCYKQGRKGVTINSDIAACKSITNMLIERNFVEINPFIGIKKQIEIVSKQHFPYNDEQKTQIKESVLKEAPELWNFILFVYYLYTRISETRLLKVWNVKGKKLFIPAEISKNKKNEYVSIPEPLQKIIKSMKLERWNPNFYIFGIDGVPAEKPASKNHYSKKYRTILEKLHYSEHYTLYGWKHSGNVDAYLSGVGVKGLQQQNRHYDLTMTDKYLKSLGLNENKEIQKFTKEI